MEYFAHSQKEFIYKYVVMLTDVDQFKHMSFANYLKLMFLASDALFSGFSTPEFMTGKRLRLRDIKMQFKWQTVAGDNILIKINASQEMKSQIILLHTFVNEGTAALVGLGKQIFEIQDTTSSVPTDVPDDIRKLLMPIWVDEEHLLYHY